MHFEIPFDDKARAMKFYTEALGWQLQDMPQMNYVMAETTPIGQDQMPTERAYARITDTEGNVVGIFSQHQ